MDGEEEKKGYCECNTLNQMGCQSFASFRRAFSDRMDSLVRLPHGGTGEGDAELTECYRWGPNCQLYKDVRVYILT